MRSRYVVFAVFAVAFLIATSALSQDAEKPLVFRKKVEISVSNPIDTPRKMEPVVIPLADIRKSIPDFTADCFRIRRTDGDFEPLDIPSQILKTNGALITREDLVFSLDLGPGETKTVELWYSPERNENMLYPKKTQSFGQWYHMGSNIAWENELIAYRSYTGVVDFFAKSLPHLRLHNLPPDSYHHERFWGVDPYMIGEKPGLCGIKLVKGTSSLACFSVAENSGLTFVHTAVDGGPVATGAIVQVFKGKELLVEEVYILFDGRHENIVTSAIPKKSADEKTLIAPGMQRFETPPATGKSYVAFHGIPVEEYGTISTALIWNPAEVRGSIINDPLGDYIPLQPDANGMVKYLSVGTWNRASSAQPVSNAQFLKFVDQLSSCFANPVKVSIAAKR